MRAAVLFVCLSSCAWLEELSSPEPEPVVHTVERGDTLWAISQEHGVSVADLKSANALTGDTIDVGQELIIPGVSAPGARSDDDRPSASASSGGPSRPSSRPSPAAPAASPSATAGLTLPAERSCLFGPTDVTASGDEPSMVSSAGLSHAQIKASMDGFLGHLSRCVTGDWPSGVATYEITVACTGRVSRVFMQDDGGLAPELVSCVSGLLRYVSFPAHDLPDGETFVYPVQFSLP